MTIGRVFRFFQWEMHRQRPPSLTPDAHPVALFYKHAYIMTYTPQFRRALQGLLVVEFQRLKYLTYLNIFSYIKVKNVKMHMHNNIAFFSSNFNSF